MLVPVICGENTGKHSEFAAQTNDIIRVSPLYVMFVTVYVDIGANSGDTATISLATTATASNRMWDIKVTQAS